jgi:nitrous oxide reductase accessory protein NosL
MKRKILIAFLFIPFLLASCETDDNYGYPSKITFQKEGGIIFCSGASGCYSIDIDNYNGDGATSLESDRDSIKVTYDWLTVKCKRSTSAQLEMIAAPNPSKKKRTLYVYPMIDDFSAETKVVQY